MQQLVHSAHLAFTHLDEWLVLLRAQWQGDRLLLQPLRTQGGGVSRVGGGGAAAQPPTGAACSCGACRLLYQLLFTHPASAAAKERPGAPAPRPTSAQRQQQAPRAPAMTCLRLDQAVGSSQAPKAASAPHSAPAAAAACSATACKRSNGGAEMRKRRCEANAAHKPAVLPPLRMPPGRCRRWLHDDPLRSLLGLLVRSRRVKALNEINRSSTQPLPQS